MNGSSFLVFISSSLLWVWNFRDTARTLLLGGFRNIHHGNLWARGWCIWLFPHLTCTNLTKMFKEPPPINITTTRAPWHAGMGSCQRYRSRCYKNSMNNRQGGIWTSTDNYCPLNKIMQIGKWFLLQFNALKKFLLETYLLQIFHYLPAI